MSGMVRQADAIEAQGSAVQQAELRDYWRLLKPNVMQLVVFTGGVGLYLAPGHLHPLLALTAVLCIAAGAGASAAINNWFDVDIDKIMTRTQRRPTAAGRIEPSEALGTGIVLALFSVMLMTIGINHLAAGLLALTIGFYVFIYTMWLKRRTPQNIVIGGAAGSFPPMIGWAAVTGDISLMPVALFAIIFFWTPPHFWALALYRSKDYAAANVPMLPVVAGERTTCNQILGYTILLSAISLVPAFVGAGLFYLAAAVVLGGAFILESYRLWKKPDDRQSMRTFKVSIVYLFGIFLALLVDKAVFGAWSLW